MNWIKRAFRSISYHKKNTILMFLSFLILSILILFGLCIRAASRERIWEIRTSIGGSVLVSNERQIYSEEPRGVNSISHQKYLELCADERIRFGSCNTVTAALAALSKFICYFLRSLGFKMMFSVATGEHPSLLSTSYHT